MRMSMNKINLYNMSRLRSPTHPTVARTQNFFKQKWVAKSELRSYHGEFVREGQWERMFNRRLESVVPMDAAYMAVNDGFVESSGRGSGLRQKEGRKKELQRTPYMLQTFAPLERRLDIALYRALFASSARQARQFVIHGRVTVNGKKVRAARIA
jgi:ribosomal protein S4